MLPVLLLVGAPLVHHTPSEFTCLQHRVRPIRASPVRGALLRRSARGRAESQLCKGMLVMIDGEPFEVLSVIAGDPSQRQSKSKLKVRHVGTGAVAFRTVKTGSKIEELATVGKTATYSFFDESQQQFVFMDSETFEEVRLHRDQLGDMTDWLTAGVEVDVKLIHGKVLSFGFRSDVIEEVVGLKPWSTPTGGTMHADHYVCACLSNGLTRRGPPYLKVGDRVVIDPQTGNIVKRV
eukprot:UN1496